MTSKNCRNACPAAVASLTAMIVAATAANSYGVDLLTQNFDGLALNPVVTFESEVRSRAAWTKSVPTGGPGIWSIDDSAMAPDTVGNPLKGVTEFEGWTFVDRDWWISTAGDQDRSKFVSASGVIAVADNDEWDDFGLSGLTDSQKTFESTMKISSIPLQGIAPNTAKLFFHSAWTPEEVQKASLTVKYNDPASTTKELINWTSVQDDPNYKKDALNEAVNLNLENPAGATTATLEFRVWDATNNWYWAVDNLSMFTGAAPAQDGALRLIIDRGTSQVKVVNNTNGAVNLRGYTIQSRFGTLDEAGANYLGDANPNWVILDGEEVSEISEGYAEGHYAMPTAAANPALGQINLGNVWRKYSQDVSDISFQYLVEGSNAPVNGIIEFVGNGDKSYDSLDLNFNGSIEIGDYASFLAGYGTSLTGKTDAQRQVLGDLNNDKKHSVLDFLEFKTRYDAALGAGAFSAALASVPEPSTGFLACMIAVAGVVGRRRRHLMKKIAACAAVGVVASGDQASANLPLFLENFDGITLRASPEQNPSRLNVWNGTGPSNWIVNSSGVPGLGNSNTDGNRDWAGWAFVDKKFWTDTQGQGRDLFTRATGNVMVADPDAWTDGSDDPDSNTDISPKQLYDTFATTPTINIPAGIPAGKIRLAFDSSWRPEGMDETDTPEILKTNNQTATVKVAYGNKPAVEVLKFDSDPASATYHPKPTAVAAGLVSENESITIDLAYNGIDSSLKLEFGLGVAYNDWWWAVDNIRVFVPAEPSILQINTATGKAAIIGGDVISTSITGYDITSDKGNLAISGNVGLSFTKPDSIDGIDPDSTVGNSLNESWQLASSNANQFSELFLDGNSAFANSRTESLGKIFNTATPLADRDAKFSYTTIYGDVINGVVQYVSTPEANNADFDADGDVDGSDFLSWQRGFGTGTTQAQGNADGDLDVDAADLAIWKSQFGQTGLTSPTAATVPEPSSLGLSALALAALGWTARWRRRGRTILKSTICTGAAVVSVAASLPGDVYAQPIPAPFVDRNYRMGDNDPSAVANQIVSGDTWDSAGQMNAGQLIDLTAYSNSAAPNPSYVAVTGRPDGVTGLGIRLNALSSSKNFLRTFPDEALNFPEKSPSSRDGSLPGGSLDYSYITDRGFQLWVQPQFLPAANSQAHIVMDTNNHGVTINGAGRFSMRYSTFDYAGTTPVVANTWYHLMVVRPAGPDNGSILYVNGVAEAAATGGYFGEDIPNDEIDVSNQDNSPLVIGANTDEGLTGLGSQFFYRGIVDDLEMFVMGLNATSDRGEFKYERDNKYAAHFKPTTAADLTGDGQITMADVTIFADHWMEEKRLHWMQDGSERSLVVGDLSSRAKGDFNYDGRINLADWAILNTANSAMAAAAMSLIQAVPEPSTAMLAGLAIAGLRAARGKRRHRFASRT